MQAATFLLLAASMAPAIFGQFALYFTIAATVSLVGRFGLNYGVAIWRSQGDSRAADCSTWLALFATGAAAPLLIVLPHGPILALLAIATTGFTISQYDLLGRRDYAAYAKSALLKGGLMLALAPLGYSLGGVSAALLATAAANLAAGWSAYRAGVTLETLQSAKSLVSDRGSVILQNFLVDVATNLSRRFDKLLVGIAFGTEVLGYFQFGMHILFALELVPIVMQQVTLVEKTFIRVTSIRWTLILFAAGLVFSLAALAALSTAIPIYFPAYASEILSIQVLIFAVPFLMLSAVYNSALQRAASKRVGWVSLYRSLVLMFLLLVLGTLFDVTGLAAAVLIAAAIQCGALAALHAKEFNAATPAL